MMDNVVLNKKLKTAIKALRKVLYKMVLNSAVFSLFEKCCLYLKWMDGISIRSQKSRRVSKTKQRQEDQVCIYRLNFSLMHL